METEKDPPSEKKILESPRFHSEIEKEREDVLLEPVRQLKRLKTSVVTKKLIGVDLFTGCGGLSLGLKDYIEPVCYSEIDYSCRIVLKQRVEQGRFPEAILFGDVKNVKGKDCLKLSPTNKIDIVYGGFPCGSNFNYLDRHSAVEKDQTTLFRELIRVARECDAEFLFVENVASLARQEMKDFFNDIMRVLLFNGYVCRWTLLNANHVGAPHLRRRWFCLARKCRYLESIEFIPERDGFNVVTKSIRSDQRESAQWNDSEENGWEYDISVDDLDGLDYKLSLSEVDADKIEPSGIQRLTESTRNVKDRLRLVGSVVVPLHGKRAFEMLSGLLETEIYDGDILELLKKNWDFKIHNYCERWWYINLISYPRDYVLDPANYVHPVGTKRKLTSPLVSGPVGKKTTPTIVSRGNTCSRVLTKRCSRDISTFLRWENGTKDEQRGHDLTKAYSVSPDYAEWLMGLPKDWTKVYMK